MERYQISHKALGTNILITVVDQPGSLKVKILMHKLIDMIGRFEQQFSRFLPSSELTRFNLRAGEKVTVSPSFNKLLRAVNRASQLTGGIFNPFVLPALQTAGYLGSYTKDVTVAEPLTNFSKRRLAEPDQLTIGKSWAKIPAGTALDLGGIGKGYLLDEIKVHMGGQSGYWISLGGDIICGGFDIDKTPWQIGVQGALTPDLVVEQLVNTDGRPMAVATSGVTKRRGLKDLQNWHHLIDPRTQQPAKTDILTATVTANEATLADVLAKAIVIGGTKLAKQYLAKNLINSYLIQVKDPETADIRVDIPV